METKNRTTGYAATHPGEILREELKERGIKQKDFAKTMGVQPSHLSEFIRGKISLSSDWAILLEKHLGIDYQNWMNLQAGYDYDSKVIAARSIPRAKSVFPFKFIMPISKEAYQALSGIKNKPKYVSGLILQAAGAAQE